MSSIKIRLPDNSIKTFDHEPTVLEVAESIGSGLAKSTVGGQINDSKEVVDLRTKLHDGDQLSIVTAQSPEGREVLRHSKKCQEFRAPAVICRFYHQDLLHLFQLW